MSKGASFSEKHGKGGKALRLYKENFGPNENGHGHRREYTHMHGLPPIGGTTHGEVIPKPQLIQSCGNGKVYKAILANIGVDSPTLSHETGGSIQKENLNMQQANTSIRTGAGSLMALGNYMFTARQGRSKSPLGSWTTRIHVPTSELL